jgi:predicted 3-demethylubiquinone-9 3-methyltransferase (glyoxalase superfamily)
LQKITPFLWYSREAAEAAAFRIIGLMLRRGRVT